MLGEKTESLIRAADAIRFYYEQLDPARWIPVEDPRAGEARRVKIFRQVRETVGLALSEGNTLRSISYSAGVPANLLFQFVGNLDERRKAMLVELRYHEMCASDLRSEISSLTGVAEDVIGW